MPPVRTISDRKAALLACGCMLLVLTADGVVTGVLVYLLLRWFGWLR
ncbi:MAG TPA: hypothetical protein VFG68_09400 [Fimbriiglobus sp.]|nr:hypothetical protein [Fimbriiglobus sp.]